MKIVLIRHGIAVDRAETDLADAERPLTDRGVDRTRSAARGLRALGLGASVLLSSPLVRAVQTASIVARELRIPSSAVRTTKTLGPDAAPEAVVAEVLELGRLGTGARKASKAAGSRDHHGDESAKSPCESVLLVGHAPHLDRLLAHLLTQRTTLFTSLKKAGVACVELDDDASNRSKSSRRRKVAPQGFLRWLLEPKHLRRLR